MKVRAVVARVLAVGILAGLPYVAAASRADPTQGLCNALIAQALGTGLQVANDGPSFEQCTEIGLALGASLEPPCVDLVLNNALGLLIAANHPSGALSPLGTNICTSLAACGFTPLPFGLCPGF
jgi:hypothetical protein